MSDILDAEDMLDVIEARRIYADVIAPATNPPVIWSQLSDCVRRAIRAIWGMQFVPQVDLRGADLRGADLRGMSFRHLRDIGARVAGAKFDYRDKYAIEHGGCFGTEHAIFISRAEMSRRAAGVEPGGNFTYDLSHGHWLSFRVEEISEPDISLDAVGVKARVSLHDSHGADRNKTINVEWSHDSALEIQEVIFQALTAD